MGGLAFADFHINLARPEAETQAGPRGPTHWLSVYGTHVLSQMTIR
jgi:hypothetical protein